jgi:uncharacterized protein YdhG (YjbR/CyaY superfamily)
MVKPSTTTARRGRGLSPSGAKKSVRKPDTVDAYIASFDPAVRALLQKVRATVKAAAPGAVELLSYGIPALKRNGVLVHFAAFKGHIGFYPPIKGDPKLEKAASVYAGDKGNLRFPYDQPIPYDLIAALTRLRAEQDLARGPPKRKAARK